MFPTLKKHKDNFLKEVTMGNFASEEDAEGNIFVDRGQAMADVSFLLFESTSIWNGYICFFRCPLCRF